MLILVQYVHQHFELIIWLNRNICHDDSDVPVGLAVGVQAKILVVTAGGLLHDDRLLLIVRGGRLPFLVLLILVVGDDKQLLLRACLPSLTLDSYIIMVYV